MATWHEETQTVVLERTPWGRMTRNLADVVEEYETRKARQQEERVAAIEARTQAAQPEVEARS